MNEQKVSRARVINHITKAGFTPSQSDMILQLNESLLSATHGYSNNRYVTKAKFNFWQVGLAVSLALNLICLYFITRP